MSMKGAKVICIIFYHNIFFTKRVSTLIFLKIRFISSIKKFIADRRGFSLVELMIVISLLAIVLAVSTNFYIFSVRTFEIGEQQANVQQNARLAAGFITKELRIAERVIIVNERENLSELDVVSEDEFFIYHIYLEDGSMYYQKIDTGEGIADSFEGISSNIEFDVLFKASEAQDNLLHFNITAKDVDSGRTYSLETEVLALNANKIEDESDGGGLALLYQIPAPPNPAIMSIILDPQSHSYTSAQDHVYDVEVTIHTKNVIDGSEVRAEFWHLDEDDQTSLVSGFLLEPFYPTIVNNRSDFSISLPSELYFGDYYMEAAIDSVEYPQRRYYYIEPNITIKIDDKSGEPFYGDVLITTGGVPGGTEAVIQVYEQGGNVALEKGIDYTIHGGEPVVDANGAIEFSLKVESHYINTDLVLAVTIGKTTQQSAEFFIED